LKKSEQDVKEKQALRPAADKTLKEKVDAYNKIDAVYKPLKKKSDASKKAAEAAAKEVTTAQAAYDKAKTDANKKTLDAKKTA